MIDTNLGIEWRKRALLRIFCIVLYFDKHLISYE